MPSPKKVNLDQPKHVHVKGKQISVFGDERAGDTQVDYEWGRQYSKVPIENVYDEVWRQLSSKFLFIDATTKYHYDMNGDTAYYKLEIYSEDVYPNTIIQVDIFSCYCDDKAWQTGKPPF